MSATTAAVTPHPIIRSEGRRNYARGYWLFALPAAVVVAAVIVFPWIFTLIMSVYDWKVSGNVYFAGARNYIHLTQDSDINVSQEAFLSIIALFYNFVDPFHYEEDLYYF